VKRIRELYPNDSTEQLARRLISSKAQLSIVSGALTHLPMLVPGIGQALQLIGLVGGTTVMTRMHLYLILEIALLYEKDIDDAARLPEIAGVASAVALGTAAPLLVQLLDLNPLYALPAGAISAAAVTLVVGESAIRMYRVEESVLSAEAVDLAEVAS